MTIGETKQKHSSAKPNRRKKGFVDQAMVPPHQQGMSSYWQQFYLKVNRAVKKD